MRNIFLFIIIACIVSFSCTRKSGPNSSTQNHFSETKANLKNDTLIINDSESDVDYYVTVIKIVDGDTFDGLTQDKIEIRYRFQGIDAPERNQAYSTKSKERLSELIYGKRVGIKVNKKRDGYGRPVVYVSTKECDDVGAEMLKSGMAWHSKKYDNSILYDELEKEARKNKKGLWADDNPIPPWKYRE